MKSSRADARPQTATAPEGSARAQIKEYKETLILDAATSLFHERGFERTTLDDIASALGVTKPFIYTYFDSKHHLLERLFDRVFEHFEIGVEQFEKLSEKDPVQRFELFISVFLEYNLSRRQHTAFSLKEEKHLSPEKLADFRRRQREFDQMLASVVADGVKAGVFKVEDPQLASFALSGMVRWTHRWYKPEGRLSAEQIRAQMTAMALRLVGYEPAFRARAPKTAPRKKAPAQAKRAPT
ncbi:TetR family transcriptional regulator [Ramlibacter sp.]|uniref:TetR family transcriptional regulator n=1 Tax=Ramlibacter sp. TaxID=1917967 RepID=UPI003D14597E